MAHAKKDATVAPLFGFGRAQIDDEPSAASAPRCGIVAVIDTYPCRQNHLVAP